MGILLQQVSCLKCRFDQPDSAPPVFELELNDTRAFERVCPNGHEVTIVIQNPRHELLFEVAMRALCDGDTRGAVFNAASALEAFYLFFIDVAFRIKRVTSGPRAPKRWKWLHVSERQMGGFAVAHGFLFGAPPPDAILQLSALRNDVIHAGFVPTQAVAEKYVQAVYEVVVPLASKLREQDEEMLQQEIALQTIEASQRIAAGRSPVVSLLGTVICCSNLTASTRSFDDARKDFEAFAFRLLQASKYIQLSQMLAPDEAIEEK